VVVPSRNLGIATCAHSGVTIPECCCAGCLEDQIRRYRPTVLSRQARVQVPSEISGANASQAGMSANPPIGEATSEIGFG